MIDLAEVSVTSHFSHQIHKYFRDNRPKRIIETGLYHGNGSTSLILSLIINLNLNDSEFYSIECNHKNIEIAKANLIKYGVIDYVEILEGLSIPKELLPNHQEVCDLIREAKNNRKFVDHEVGEAAFYYKETIDFKEDDVLGKIFNKFNGQVDFILLDSAGHIGNIEFNYLLPLIKSRCAIALDDTKHIKHYKSLEKIKSDNRFNLIYESDEKFGSALTIFTP